MRLTVEISVQDSPWPRGGTTALERELRASVMGVVINVAQEREAMIKAINFVKPRGSK